MSLLTQILFMLRFNESIKEMNWEGVWISDTRKKRMTLVLYIYIETHFQPFKNKFSTCSGKFSRRILQIQMSIELEYQDTCVEDNFIF